MNGRKEGTEELLWAGEKRGLKDYYDRREKGTEELL